MICTTQSVRIWRTETECLGTPRCRLETRGTVVFSPRGVRLSLSRTGSRDRAPVAPMTLCPCAERDADQHSSDEIMELGEDAGGHALPSSDDVVQPVQGSRSSNSSSSSSSPCSDNVEELAGCPFSVLRNIGGCMLRYEERQALRGNRRFILQCNQHPKLPGQQKDQRASYATPGAVRVCGLLCCVGSFGRVCVHQIAAQRSRAQESHLGVEPARVASKQQLHVDDRLREPQLKRKTRTNSVNTATTPHQS